MKLKNFKGTKTHGCILVIHVKWVDSMHPDHDILESHAMPWRISVLSCLSIKFNVYSFSDSLSYWITFPNFPAIYYGLSSFSFFLLNKCSKDLFLVNIIFLILALLQPQKILALLIKQMHGGTTGLEAWISTNSSQTWDHCAGKLWYSFSILLDKISYI